MTLPDILARLKGPTKTANGYDCRCPARELQRELLALCGELRAIQQDGRRRNRP